MTRSDPPPLLPLCPQSGEILAAMAAVAKAGGAALSEMDRRMLRGAERFIFAAEPSDLDRLAESTPQALAASLSDRGLAQEALRFLAVMSIVDGAIEEARIQAVLAYAEALSLDDPYLKILRMSRAGEESAALAEMTNFNMISITGQPWRSGDINDWLQPYGEGQDDPALAARFEALGDLPAGAFGQAFWAHFKANAYQFPGEPEALNGIFSVPHDAAHVLSGFGTDARGEILVSTFTSTMHPIYPLAGHVLPVIFTWHLDIQINRFAGDDRGCLDPEVFWRAWAGGAATSIDTFDPAWNFWDHVEEPLIALRRRWSLPDAGLDLEAT
ncbi:MAG: hypothetical protein Kilf2KO_09880 [Rhodospirillales bacterium]